VFLALVAAKFFFWGFPGRGRYSRIVCRQCDTFTLSLVEGDKEENDGRVASMRAKILSAGSAAFLLSLVFVDGASAAGGCGPGFHPDLYGRCLPNRGAVVVAPAAPVVVAPAAPVVVAPAVVAPAAPVVVAPAVVVPAPVVCGAGFRWHPRFRRCVVL
jgi:hypothetical protein